MCYRNTGIEVEPGEARLISSAVLSAHDNDTPSTNIIYVFESVPVHGLLQIKVSAQERLFLSLHLILTNIDYYYVSAVSYKLYTIIFMKYQWLYVII